MSDTQRQVIVLTRNYSTGLGVIRSLGAAGFPVELIASVHKSGACDIAAASRFVKGFTEVVSKKVKDDDDDPELIAEILKYAGKFDKTPVLFPTDDYTASMMDLHRTELAPFFLMPTVRGGTNGTLSGLMDKTVQAEMAKAAGLTVPMAWRISLRDEKPRIPGDMVYPCYVKPIRSIEGYKTEMAVCENMEELAAHLDLMRGNFANRDVLVQEYLDIDREIAIAGACLYDRVIIPAVIRKTRIGKHGRGVTLTGEMAPFDTLGDDVTKKAFALLRSFGYHGTFGMEFNIVGDKVYFNEVNLRSAGESFAYYNCGVNLPLIYVKSLLGEDISPDEEKMTRFGQTLVYDKIAWEDCIYGFMTREELDECLESADIKILCCDDDPEPGELFVSKNTEALEREEKKRKLQRAREKCLESVVSLTGWDSEYALSQINEARERLNIGYSDYRKAQLCLVPADEQAAAYEKYLKKEQELNALREECIKLAMEKNGWDEKTAREQIKRAKDRFGISYKDYKKYEFYAVPEAEQAEAYKKIEAKKELIRRQKEDCITATAEGLHCGRDEALAVINDARERLGISYKDYRKYEFWQIKPEQQKPAYEKIKLLKGKDHGK